MKRRRFAYARRATIFLWSLILVGWLWCVPVSAASRPMIEAAPCAPAAVPYRYGFSAPAYHWGWFGAGRYEPRVVWHRGYYGDCVRWAEWSAY